MYDSLFFFLVDFDFDLDFIQSLLMMMELSNLLKITLLILLCCIYIFLVVPSSIEGEESKIKNVQYEIRRRLIPKRKLPPKANTIKANGTIIGPPVGAEGPRVRQKPAVQRIRNTTTVDLPSLFKVSIVSCQRLSY
jgi:hypothetical protein